jgi:predicted transcriptional regulator
MQKDHGESPVLTDDAERPSSSARLTAEIVSAYVSNNKTAPADVAALITAVAGQLSKVGAKPEQPREEKSDPAVSVRRSIRPDHLVCLVCGKPRKMLKRHLAVQHELMPAEYRERFGLKPDYPMTAPNYAQQRREVALATGLGRPKPAPPGRKPGPRSRAADQGQQAGDNARP